MRQSTMLMFFFMYVFTSPGFSQTKFIKGFIVTNNGEKLEGSIKKSFTLHGKITFLSSASQKMFYSPSDIKGFSIEGTNYVSYSNDFYKEILEGKKASLYQKSTNNGNQAIYNGPQMVGFMETTEGNIGDYYLRLSSGAKLDLITKKNFKEYFRKLFYGNDSLIAKIEDNDLNYTKINQAVELFNN